MTMTEQELIAFLRALIERTDNPQITKTSATEIAPTIGLNLSHDDLVDATTRLHDDDLIDFIPEPPRHGDSPATIPLKPTRHARDLVATSTTAPPTAEPTDTWTRRDLPVLRAVAVLLETNPPGIGCRFSEITQHTGLAIDDVRRAVDALESAHLIETRRVMSPSGASRVTQLSADARRLVGQWPSPEQVADQMLRFLDERAEEATTPDERSRWTRIRDSFASSGRQFSIELAAAITAKWMGA